MGASRLAVSEAAASIIGQRVSPPTVTPGKRIARVMRPSPYRRPAFAHYGVRTQPKRLLSRRAQLLSLLCRHGPGNHTTYRRCTTPVASLPWVSDFNAPFPRTDTSNTPGFFRSHTD